MILGLVAVIGVAMLATAAPQTPSSIDVPVLPTEKDEFGGRPGSFHFVTNEQKMVDAAEMKRAMEALERLDARIATMKGSERATMSEDVKAVREFARNVHVRRTTSAGESAEAIEKRLNAAKGKFMCGACHGPGMMHGGGRMGRKRAE